MKNLKLVQILWKGKQAQMWARKRSRNDIGTLRETFTDGEYDSLDVKGKVVVDVGAYIGDTALYFHLRGARRVWLYEPHPVMAAVVRENVRLWGWKRGREYWLHQKAWAAREGRRWVPGNANAGFGSGQGPWIREEVDVRFVDCAKELEKIARVEKGERLVLKVDVEWWEGEIFSRLGKEQLRLCEAIMVECHGKKNCEVVRERLEQVGKVRETKQMVVAGHLFTNLLCVVRGNKTV